MTLSKDINSAPKILSSYFADTFNIQDLPTGFIDRIHRQDSSTGFIDKIHRQDSSTGFTDKIHRQIPHRSNAPAAPPRGK